MIVNNNITQTDPPIKKELAKKYYSDIALENGIELSDQALEFWVSDGDLKNNISRFHTNYGLGKIMPKGEKRDSIYNSWLEKEDAEKKIYPRLYQKIYLKVQTWFRFRNHHPRIRIRHLCRSKS